MAQTKKPTLNLPSRVKVGAHEFIVKYPYTFKERVDITGQCDHTLCEFRISKFGADGCEQTESKKLATTFHELIHAINNVFNGDVSMDEKIVEGLAQGFAAVLIDNEGLFENLWQRQQEK